MIDRFIFLAHYCSLLPIFKTIVTIASSNNVTDDKSFSIRMMDYWKDNTSQWNSDVTPSLENAKCLARIICKIYPQGKEQ